MERIRLLIADDHPVLRTGLRAIFEQDDLLEVVGEAESADETIEKAKELGPDVALVDLRMPGDGLEAIQTLHRECPQVRCVALTMQESLEVVRAAFNAGAAGFLVKSAARQELIAAVKAIHEGRTIIDVPLVEDDRTQIVSDGTGSDVEDPVLEKLSDREKQVLLMVAQGFTNQEISKQLYISPKTVATYRARLKDKLDLTTRSELVRFAMDHGLLGSPEPSSGP